MNMGQPPSVGMTGTNGEADVNPENQRLIFWAFLSLAIFQVILVVDSWGRWGLVGALCALNVVRAFINAGVPAWSDRSGHHKLGMALVLGGNLLISTVTSELLQWNALGWCNVLFQAVFINGFRERENHSVQRLALVIFLVVSAAQAFHAGCTFSTVVPFCIVAWLLYVIGEERCQLLLSSLEASRENHRQLQRMQARLVAQEKLSSLGMLAAGVAHEINNPMAFVTSNVHALSRDLEGLHQRPQELREYVEEVLPATLDGIRRVNAIVADLRRFACDDPGKSTLFDLNAEVCSALRLSQGELKGRSDVQVELGELPPLVGQARQIGQVLVNLIVNAAQALPEKGGVVKVSTQARSGEVLVRVRDNGLGMSAEVRDKLFQPFFTTKPVGQGTGLGLAVAYGIITAHGGSIEVESEPGKGTCFTVRLPSVASLSPEAPTPVTRPPLGVRRISPA
ncbi:ATP-binding protein [Archangium sp.]|uniref:sensor histidine kinase n=1 Tax=Archangium sp. TaxID=1872627 RepID=UPI00286AEA31|nr:ATP-binding protein [Archangium sp.]